MKIEVNDFRVKLAFRLMRIVGASPSVYLPPIGAIIKESTRMRFVTSTAPDGSTWKPVLRGGMPLRDTGTHLMNAISYQVIGNSVTVGVPYAWASVHQWGKRITAKRAPFLVFRIGKAWIRKRSVYIPARPFLGLSVEDKMDIRNSLIKSLLPA